MSLIEKFGGYMPAYNHSKQVSLPELDRELLEYRRANNLIAAGDQIVIDNKPELYTVQADDIGSHWIHLVSIRHADDAEIQSGVVSVAKEAV